MKWFSCQCLHDFGVDKVDRQATQPQIIMKVFSPLPDELTPAYGTSKTGVAIGEPCLKPPVNVV
jgi:hypothetical protein